MTLATVCRNGFLQKFPTGTDLITEGDHADFLYVLLDGMVELKGSWNDRETTISVLRPVSTFIISAVLLEVDALMNARTIARSEILLLSDEAVRQIMTQDARFAFAVSRELAGAYRGLVRSIKSLKMRGGAERLANYLLSEHTRQGGRPTLLLTQEKRVLASLLGMTPENLSRAFASLSEHGVAVNGPHVTLSYPAMLEQLAKPDRLIDSHLPALSGADGMAEQEFQANALHRERIKTIGASSVSGPSTPPLGTQT